MLVTMIGHSTLILDDGETRLITDPYFGTFGHVAYSRPRPPAGKRSDYLDVGGVLVSHGHWDHVDRRYLRSLDPSIPVLVPSLRSLVMKLKGARNVVPMAVWESRRIGSARVTAVPALHIARTVGYVVEMGGLVLYFAGDTYHRPFMKEIALRFRVDVAMIPVASFRLPPTMGERGALATVMDIRPARVIPIHLGVQPRSPLLRTRQSAAGFERRLRVAGLETEMVHLREGESWESTGGPAPSSRDSLRAARPIPGPAAAHPTA